MSSTPVTVPTRILSLDQFRGYTMFGMFLVNFLGRFGSMPEMMKHHEDYMTYADTIAPLFLFIAGMGFRLSFLHNQERLGGRAAFFLGLRRYLILTLIGIFFYSPMDWTGWWDALVDIGLSGVLALPFMGARTRTRVTAACVYLALYQALFIWTPYGAWDMQHSFDGGPLGPLSWVFSLLLGTVLYDLVAENKPGRLAWTCLAWGVALCAAGWLLHMEWTGIKAYWAFSQKSMAAPYPLFATGLAFLAYLPFHFLCDRWGRELPTLTVLGANPLVLYMIHGAYLDLHGVFIPDTSGPLAALLAFTGFYALLYIIARYLYKNKLFVKI